MDFIIPLLFLISNSIFYSTIFKKNIAETIPFTIIISSLLLYIFSIFNTLTVGFYFLILISIIFSFYIIAKIKKLEEIKYLFINNGLYIFLILYTFVYILDLNRGLNACDEINHWGPMVKEIFTTGQIYHSQGIFTFAHRDYPPIFQIWESFWCFISLGYKESCLYKSLHIACLSIFLPIFINNSKKSIIYNILVVISIISACNIIPLEDGNFGSTIYLDAPLMLIAAYCNFIILKDIEFNKFNILKLILSLSFLLLIKQIAILFYLISITIFIISFLLKENKEINTKNIITIISIIIIPLIFLYSWKEFSKGITQHYNASKVSISSISKIISGNKNFQTQHQTFLKFKKAIFTKDLIKNPVIPNTLSFIISITSLLYILINIKKINQKKYIILISILAILILFGTITFFTALNIITTLFLLLQSFNKNNKKNIIYYSIIFLGGFGYIFSIMIIYCFFMNEYEILMLSSFIRYANTYIYYILIFTIMLLFEYITNSNNDEKYLIYFIIFISIFNLIRGEISLKIPYNNQSIINKYLESSEIIKNKTKDMDKIHIISQGDQALIIAIFPYINYKRQYNRENFSLGEADLEKNLTNEIFRINLTKKELSDFLINGKYQYLYIHKIDEQFINKYGNMFENNIPKEKNIYIIKTNKGKVTFEQI